MQKYVAAYSAEHVTIFISDFKLVYLLIGGFGVGDMWTLQS